MTSPNDEPVMNTAEMHAIEHLAATFLRNHPVFGNKIIYFGPMGCRTGFYLLLAGDYCSEDIIVAFERIIYIYRRIHDEILVLLQRLWQLSGYESSNGKDTLQKNI